MREFTDPFSVVSKIINDRKVGTPRFRSFFSAIAALKRGDQPAADSAIRDFKAISASKKSAGELAPEKSVVKPKPRRTGEQGQTLLTPGSDPSQNIRRRSLLGVN